MASHSSTVPQPMVAAAVQRQPDIFNGSSRAGQLFGSGALSQNGVSRALDMHSDAAVGSLLSTKAAAPRINYFHQVRDEKVAARVLETLRTGLADPKARSPPDKQGITWDLMFFAAAREKKRGGSEEIARRLHELGVPGNSEDERKQTPLFFAAREGNTGCAQLLLEWRCEVNHQDVHKQTPLFYAARQGHLEMCRVLTQKGGSWNTADTAGKTARNWDLKGVEEKLLQLNNNGHHHALASGSVIEEMQMHPDPVGRKVVHAAVPQGSYIVTYEHGLPVNESFSRQSKELTRLQKNTQIEIVEFADVMDEGRVRAKIRRPLGWISFQYHNPDDLKVDCFAERKDKAALAANGTRQVSLQPLPPQKRQRTMQRKESGEATPTSGGSTPSSANSMTAWMSSSCSRICQSLAEVGGDAALARAGEYHVRFPELSDVPRLRDLEKEFVSDHYELFRQETWHGKLSVSDWCRLVNVIHPEDKATQAIMNIVRGEAIINHQCHATLECVHDPSSTESSSGSVRASGAAKPQIVGYVHFVYANNILDISHLKVARTHQRRGLGSLLLAGAARWAEQQHWDANGASLVVVRRNSAALALYRALDFAEDGGPAQKTIASGGKVIWQRMCRNFSDSSPATFARQCEARANATSKRLSTNSGQIALPARAKDGN